MSLLRSMTESPSIPRGPLERAFLNTRPTLSLSRTCRSANDQSAKAPYSVRWIRLKWIRRIPLTPKTANGSSPERYRSRTGQYLGFLYFV